MKSIAFSWFKDGWIAPDCCLSLETTSDVQLSFFLPTSKTMPLTKRLAIYDERNLLDLEITRNNVTSVVLAAPTSGQLLVQIYSDYVEWENKIDLRRLGVVMSISTVDSTELDIRREGGRGDESRPLLLHPERDLISPSFDRDYYNERFPDDDAPTDPLLHFLTLGWRTGRDPSASFSMAHYLANSPDIAQAKLNPFVHYLLWGKDEGRLCLPPAASRTVTTSAIPTKEDLAAVRPFFSAQFYRRCYPTIAGDDEDLLIDYMTVGWASGRDPSSNFSTQYYLDRYPDIAQGMNNPLLHYALFGQLEGRRASDRAEVVIAMDDEADTVPQHLRSVMLWPNPSDKPQPPNLIDTEKLHIHWVIPDFTVGSGGHMTIFRTVRLLEIFGHTCTIWIEHPTFHETEAAAHDDIVKHFQCVAAEIRFLSNGFFSTSGDVVIATGWSTAYPVSRATGFLAKFYFVQDHEPEFYASGTEAILARNTYDFDLACICASPWLDDIMSARHGRWARHFFLAYDKEVYRRVDVPQLEQTTEDPVRIAVYARDHTSRRCVPLALMALEILAKEGANIEVHFFGQQRLPFRATPYKSFNHGVLDSVGLATLYNKCDIGISFSATNYSLVPQEMMACGLPVFELNVESTRRIFPEGVVTLSPADARSMADALLGLVNDPSRRKAQATAAEAWVAQFDWETSARTVEKAIVDFLLERHLKIVQLSSPHVSNSRSIALDLVIPTYKGMKELPPVIEALRRQHGVDQVQVHCIDSSSTDGTQEWIRQQKDISLTVIPQKDFQHGRTRNLGASLGKAPLIAFITQDATPATPFWLYDIRRMFDHYPRAAGLFGRHIAYPSHPKFIQDELHTHFAGMLKFPLALSKDTNPEKWESGDVGWRQLLHFYSDNNSAMRRDVWNDIPYADVNYGEDQVWARDIIDAGLTKLYAPTATVLHSHDYGPDETYTRSKIEGEFFFKYFGYRMGDGSENERKDRVRIEQTSYMTGATRSGTNEAEIATRLANIEAKHRGWWDGLQAGIAAASANIS